MPGGNEKLLDEITLRDYFAAAALQGLLSTLDAQSGFNQTHTAACIAYGYADAMLKEREKQDET